MKTKKKYILIFSVCFLFILLIGGTVLLYFPKKPVIHKTVDVFGTPRTQDQQSFPNNDPKFIAVIGAIKPASVHQQSIKVYQLGDSKKTTLFERPFYADRFRGDGLTYAFASGSAEITQSGSLGTIGCKTNDCTLSWSNFYRWDTGLHTFVLDNVSHKNEFQQLLAIYQDVDKKGCSLTGNNQLSSQSGLSFSDVYKKFPTASYYCSKSEGLLQSNIVFFLQAEKTLKAIVAGQNIGSADIQNVTI